MQTTEPSACSMWAGRLLCLCRCMLPATSHAYGLLYAGDRSEDFKFSSFFPDALSGPIDAIAGVVSDVFRLRHEPDAETKPLLPVTQNLLGSNAADSSRRRERGAKALQERLEMKKIAEAPVVESAAATAASVLPMSSNGPQSP
eukprot:GHUV01046853.1.p1 GENE.GHUV01046853.1~~GHUV01046853.1.p1  ORF type:complete len:144 (+),score=28.59 GHUV01046853.1:1109-1540(+)